MNSPCQGFYAWLPSVLLASTVVGCEVDGNVVLELMVEDGEVSGVVVGEGVVIGGGVVA